MKDQSNNLEQHDVMSFLNDLKDDLHFLSQFKVVNGDINLLDYVEEKNRITCQKTCQEETSGIKDPKGVLSNILKESKKLGAKPRTLSKNTTPKKKKQQGQGNLSAVCSRMTASRNRRFLWGPSGREELSFCS